MSFLFIDLHRHSTWVIQPAFLYDEALPDHPLDQELK